MDHSAANRDRPTKRIATLSMCLGTAVRITAVALIGVSVSACSVSIEPHPILSSLKLPTKKTRVEPAAARTATSPTRVVVPAPAAPVRRPAPVVNPVTPAPACAGSACTTIQPTAIRWGGDEDDSSGGGWGG